MILDIFSMALALKHVDEYISQDLLFPRAYTNTWHFLHRIFLTYWQPWTLPAAKTYWVFLTRYFILTVVYAFFYHHFFSPHSNFLEIFGNWQLRCYLAHKNLIILEVSLENLTNLSFLLSMKILLKRKGGEFFKRCLKWKREMIA